jgi:hypothetical protein
MKEDIVRSLKSTQEMERAAWRSNQIEDLTSEGC